MAALDLLASFAAGAVSFLSPCIIPMIVIYLTTITGLDFETLLAKGRSSALRKQVLAKTLAFVLAFTLVFSLIGGLAGFLGGKLVSYFGAASLVAGVLFILLGLHYTGVLRRIPWRFGSMMDEEKIASFAAPFKEKDGSLSLGGVFAVGFAFALVCSHCISPTLVPALALAASAQDFASGAAVMLAFSVGLGLSFLLAALFFAQTLSHLEWLKRHEAAARLITGLIFLFFGLLFLSGQYLPFVSLLYRLLPVGGPGM